MSNKRRYNKARMDLLQARKSVGEFRSEQQKMLCYEMFGVEATEQMLRALRK